MTPRGDARARESVRVAAFLFLISAFQSLSLWLVLVLTFSY